MFVPQIDSTNAGPVGPVGFLVGYVLSNVVPLITAWIFKKYNEGVNWLSRQNNAVKMAIYVAGTVLIMYAVQWIGVGLTDDFDIRNLGTDTVAKIVQALVATILVKLGISTAREKAGTSGGIRRPRAPRSGTPRSVRSEPGGDFHPGA